MAEKTIYVVKHNAIVISYLLEPTVSWDLDPTFESFLWSSDLACQPLISKSC